MCFQPPLLMCCCTPWVLLATRLSLSQLAWIVRRLSKPGARQSTRCLVLICFFQIQTLLHLGPNLNNFISKRNCILYLTRNYVKYFYDLLFWILQVIYYVKLLLGSFSSILLYINCCVYKALWLFKSIVVAFALLLNYTEFVKIECNNLLTVELHNLLYSIS